MRFLRAFALVESRGCDARCNGEQPPKSRQISAHKMVMHADTHHKTAQQSRGGMMDRDTKAEGVVSSEPASDLS